MVVWVKKQECGARNTKVIMVQTGRRLIFTTIKLSYITQEMRMI